MPHSCCRFSRRSRVPSRRNMVRFPVQMPENVGMINTRGPGCRGTRRMHSSRLHASARWTLRRGGKTAVSLRCLDIGCKRCHPRESGVSRHCGRGNLLACLKHSMQGRDWLRPPSDRLENERPGHCHRAKRAFLPSRSGSTLGSREFFRFTLLVPQKWTLGTQCVCRKNCRRPRRARRLSRVREGRHPKLGVRRGRSDQDGWKYPAHWGIAGLRSAQ